MSDTRTPEETAAFWAKIDELLGEEDAELVRRKMGSCQAVETFRIRWDAVTAPLKKLYARPGSSQPSAQEKFITPASYHS